MIPKKIHYCWFGGNEKPKLAKNCIASWKKYCPDYEIIEWNEDNFNVNQNAYTKMCYEQKKFAFLSDYARLMVVYNHGGIYFDVDVEVIKAIDDLLQLPAYFGFETNEYINTGLGFGAEKNNAAVKQMLDEYSEFLNGTKGVVGCPILNTNALEKMGLKKNGERQKLDFAEVFPVSYFNPYESSTGRLNKTGDTYSIHWYAKSWMSTGMILRSKIMQPIHRILGGRKER